MSNVDAEVVPIEDRLRRGDKWALGGGRKAVWAPPWPLWLDRPGFWDAACFYDVAVGPLFTLALLEPDGREIDLEFENRTWVPSHLTQSYAGGGLEITERRSLLPDDLFVSDFLIANPGSEARTVHAVVWSSPSRSGRADGHEIDRCTVDGGSIRLRHRVYREPDRLNHEFVVAYGAGSPVESTSVHLSEPSPDHPRWDLTPFRESFDGRLDGADRFDVAADDGGLAYLALHSPLLIPAGEAIHFVAACAIAETDEEARGNLEIAIRSSDPIQIAIDHWEGWFRTVPEFRCSDPYLEQSYWYRWFGLRLNRVDAGSERLPHPCIFEGVNAGRARHAVASSAPLHTIECKWLVDPDLARGTIRNFVAHQRDDGSYPGRLMVGMAETPVGSFHADWGKALRELDAHHPDESFLEEIYPSFSRYAEYLSAAHDPEESGLFDLADSGEADRGQLTRYRPDGVDGGPFRLKGVEATVYAYEMLRCLEWIAGRIGKSDDSARWRAASDRTRDAVRSRMWDPDLGFFVDVRSGTWERSPSLAATGFYPFRTDIAIVEHLTALTDHLFDPDEFWTTWPVPTTSRSDPMYSAAGEWNGRRIARPSNGRTWLRTNSHVLEALAGAAQRLDPALTSKAVQLLGRSVRMTFLEGDLRRPSSYEYYNPETGQAPIFSGADDCMGSSVADSMLRFVAGIQVTPDRLIVDPLPFDLDEFAADHVPAGGHWIRVLFDRTEGLRVFVDGEQVAASPDVRRIEVPFR